MPNLVALAKSEIKRIWLESSRSQRSIKLLSQFFVSNGRQKRGC